jgi:predicted transcriptional regulator
MLRYLTGKTRFYYSECMSEEVCDIMICDTLARNLLPRLRAEMVHRLVYQHGVSQSEVAKRLGVSRAAISQYMSRKRGGQSTPLPRDMDEIIDLWVHSVMSDDCSITLCDVCRCASKNRAW